MRDHLDAIAARLAPLGYVTHLYAAPEITGQYLILGGRGWDDGVEEGLAPTDDLDTVVPITAVTGTPAGAEKMLRLVRAELSPGRQPTRLAVPGRSAHVMFVRSELIGVDQSVKITGTDRHPGYGVESYRVVSDPL